MRKPNRFISLALALLAVLSLSACRISLPDPVEISTADEAAAMGFSAGAYESEIEAGDYSFFDVNIKIDYEYAVKWSSSNTKIATVDSNGRVDALAPGEVTITASAKKASVDYEVTVKKAAKKPLSNTTAFVSNESTLEQNATDANDINNYALLVDKAECCVIAYTYNANGTYNVPVRAMACSADKAIPEKSFRVESREQWLYTDEYNYQYATKFGDFYFCSAPYKDADPSTLVAEEYNKLGTVCTAGNIWLSAADAKWIYDNCNDTTLVKVTTNGINPLGVPKTMKLSENSKSKNWDPTDPDDNNPYKKRTPYFKGAEDTVIAVGGIFDAHEGITAYDTCSNVYEGKINVDGVVLCNKEGTYTITYTCTDSLMRTGRADRTIKVVSLEEYEASKNPTE